MKKISIYLKAIQQGSKVALHLTDSEGNEGIDTITTHAKQKDQFEWVLASESDIKKIVNIYAKPTSQNLFSEGPHKVHDDLWKGTIASDASGVEDYNIEYEYIDGSVIIDDPKIIVIPPDSPS